jgi:hypothetical protein
MIDQTTGESLMRWTVRLAVAGYLFRIWLLLRRPSRSRVPAPAECWAWTVGWLSYAAHVLLAFHFIHDWSHLDAVEHTARETERMTGIRRGEGIWVNYAFTVIWLADVVRLWLAHLRGRSTWRRLDIVLQAFFAFIFLNATVVFGSNAYRWLAIPVAIAFSWAWLRSRGSTAEMDAG